LIATKISRKYVFLGYDAHIPAWLFRAVLYIIFMGFLKKLNSTSKSNGISLPFNLKMLVHDEKWLKIHISWS
jgi:hypothetical protein